MKSTFIIGVNILLVILLIACSLQNNEKLKQALELAKENRQELEKVLNYYENDSLKLAAARYLIENMPYHFSLEEYFISPNGKKCRPDIVALSNDNAVKSHCDSLLKHNYRIVSQKKYDISTLNSQFLIENIELAFAVWQKPWAKDIPFSDFCRYILPYRAQNEKASNLRREIMQRFLPLLDSAEVKTPLEACIELQKHLKRIIKYKNTGLSLYPTLEETYYSGIGLCDGLCNLGTFIMRACGIPVTIDQTTWTKMDLAHVWCTVLNNDKFYSFDPEGQQPILHVQDLSRKRSLRPAKVYRNRFDPDFSKKDKNDDGYITYLKSPLIYDVTNEYLNETTQIEAPIDLKDIKKGKSDQVYLLTYNHYEWTPIAIGHRKDTICYFENVVGDNIFMVADSPNGGRLRNITVPFYVSQKGKIRKFIPEIENRQTFTLNKRKRKLDQEHTLHYWDTDKGRFIPLDYVSATDTTQTYDQIPGNALLWFTIPERIVNQRIFFIENDSIKTY